MTIPEFLGCSTGEIVVIVAFWSLVFVGLSDGINTNLGAVFIAVFSFVTAWFWGKYGWLIVVVPAGVGLALVLTTIVFLSIKAGIESRQDSGGASRSRGSFQSSGPNREEMAMPHFDTDIVGRNSPGRPIPYNPRHRR